MIEAPGEDITHSKAEESITVSKFGIYSEKAGAAAFKNGTKKLTLYLTESDFDKLKERAKINKHSVSGQARIDVIKGNKAVC